ncbi:voltage-dependent T-type calcium channel subunit alpha-1G [Osmerus eperlanus]|uniref:voltage-dependent T-type calcium channel subunit alpha-1G n=1 Tax=Osmerus eperlanus TaxID=29151 RepID=UPI002E13C08F
MLVILLNCVTLGMFQPCDDTHCLSTRCTLLQALDDGIFMFFAVEMVVKMLALGVMGQKGYLGDTWNRLDFFIVMVGMLEYSLDGHNVSLSAIRTVRVLRPLRAINRVPSMRILVTLLLDTLPMLGNVLLLCFFIFFIFGIVGVQLWAGLLRNRCFMGEDIRMMYNLSFLNSYYRPEQSEDLPFICSTNRENGMLRCSDVPRRRVDGASCWLPGDSTFPREEGEGSGLAEPIGGCVNWFQFYNVCRPGNLNPHKGAINFDNIGYAWIAIFQVITLEGWVDIMYYVMDAHSFYNFIYFIFLIIVGSFFMINLCLVVIATQFSETKQRESALMRSERSARRYRSDASTLASEREPGSCYEETLRYLAHLLRRTMRRLARLLTLVPCGCRRNTLASAEPSKGGGAGEVNGHAHRHSGHAPPMDVFHLHHHHLGRASHTGRGLNYPGIFPSSVYSHMTNRGRGQRQDNDRLPQLVLEHGVCVGNLALPGELPGQLLPCPYCLHDNQHSNSDNADSEPGDEALEPISSRRRADGQDSRPVAGRGVCVWAELQDSLQVVVNSRYFNRGIMIAILINTLSMGIEHHQQPEELTLILEVSNMVFTSVFSLEMLLKLLALGPCGYLTNPYNTFDSVVVIISVCEIAGQADGGLSVLRTFRLLRVLKLVRFLPALRRQLLVLVRTMDNVATFCMLLMLFIFTFSILGMHLFGCKFGLQQDSGDTLPDRKNFDSLLWAIVTVFQILTQEDWNVVLYNGMASTSPLAALYFVALMTFGNYVLFNLLVAILVEGFQAEGDASRTESDEDKQSLSYEEEEKMRELHEAELKLQMMMLAPNGLLNPRASMPRPPTPSPRPPPLIMHTAATPTTNHSQSRRASIISAEINGLEPRSPVSQHTHWDSRRSSWSSLQRRSQSGERESLLSEDAWSGWSSYSTREPSLDQSEYLQVPMLHPPDCNGTAHHLAECYHGDLPQPPRYYDDQEEEEEVEESVCTKLKMKLEPYKPQWCRDHEDCSLYVFSPQHRFRVWCHRVISHKMFDHVTLLFIFLNCITIALERPHIQPHSMERVFLSVSNCIFTVIFVAEMTVKVVALGFSPGEGGYLSSSWNVLDGVLVLVSLLDILVSIASAGGNRILGILRVLRLLRTLRPLRVISRAPGLKLVVETLITSLRPIGNIVLICCAFFIVFGILGVQLFKGKFFHCDGVDVRNITSRTDCLQAGYRWVRRKYNFDNLGQALMSLFVLSSKDGWVSIMYDGLDAVGVDQQPVRNHNPWMLLFFISFLLIVSFFVLNMFVGVVVENFHKCRQDQEEEEARLREKKRQKRLEKRRRKALEKPYYADYPPLRRSIHTLCTSHYLDLFITVIIATNVLTMAMEHYDQPQFLEEVLKHCNYLFTLVFVIEAVLKLIAFGLRRFFKDRWNQLDLAIVLLSIMGITLEEIEMSAALPINPTIIRIMRVLRIARVLKLLKMATGMRSLLDTVMQALPQVGNLGLLFMLLFFIYAALGVELFGKLECSEVNPCEGLSRHATFENMGMAFLTLFRISTGDNWNGIMKDTLRECRPEERSCLSYLPLVSPLYFVTFVLIAQFVLVNVVVAVLMKHLEESNKEARQEEQEEAQEREEQEERERRKREEQEEEKEREANPCLSVEHAGQGVEKEVCHSNLLTVQRPYLSRMLSLPNDSYMLHPLRTLAHAPFPPIGHNVYRGYGFSGSTSSMGSSGAGSLLQVPGALPAGIHASLSSSHNNRPNICLSPAHSISKHAPSRGRHTSLRLSPSSSIDRHSTYMLSPFHSIDRTSPSIPALYSCVSYHLSPAHSNDRHKLSPSYSVDSRTFYRLSPAHSVDRSSVHRLSPAHSVDRSSVHRLSPAHSMDRSSPHRLSPAHSMDRSSPHRLSPAHSVDRSSPHRLSPAHSVDRSSPHRLSPSYSVDRHTPPGEGHALHRPSSSLCGRQLKRQQHPMEEQKMSCLSQLLSPVPDRKRKQSPPCITVDPPSETLVATVTGLTDSAMHLRRRNSSFDSSSWKDSVDTPLSPHHQPETSSLDTEANTSQSGSFLLQMEDRPPEDDLLGLAPTPLRRRSLVRMLSTRKGEEP